MSYTHGHGPIRILGLHGWFGAGESWRDTIQWLDPEAYSFVAPDYRGYGERSGQQGKYTIAEIATDMFAEADRLGWESFAVAGHSMGGKAAQLMGARQPRRITRILAVNPVPPGPLAFDEPTMALFRGAVQDRALRAAIIGLTTGGMHAPSVINRLVAGSLSSVAPTAFAGYLESWVGADYSGEVTGLGTELLALVGANDPAISKALLEAEMMPLYPNSELIELAGCGHYPMNETPMGLATVFDRFLRPGPQGGDQ